jgi:hypothetical protein
MKAAQNKLNETGINKTKPIFIRKNHTKPNLKKSKKKPTPNHCGPSEPREKQTETKPKQACPNQANQN